MHMKGLEDTKGLNGPTLKMSNKLVCIRLLNPIVYVLLMTYYRVKSNQQCNIHKFISEHVLQMMHIEGFTYVFLPTYQNAFNNNKNKRLKYEVEHGSYLSWEKLTRHDCRLNLTRS